MIVLSLDSDNATGDSSKVFVNLSCVELIEFNVEVDRYCCRESGKTKIVVGHSFTLTSGRTVSFRADSDSGKAIRWFYRGEAVKDFYFMDNNRAPEFLVYELTRKYLEWTLRHNTKES